MMTLNDFLDEWNNGDDYILAQTSGSTGTPTEIRLLKSDMEASARATNTFFNITSGSRLMCPLSLDYIAGKMMAVRALIADARLVLSEPSSNPELSPCDLLALVPRQCPTLLEYPADTARAVIIGGAPLDANLRRKLITHGVNAYESYGMTETCSHVALKPITDDVYQAMPSVTFDTDSRGCLVVIPRHLSIGRVVTNDIVELDSPTRFRWLGRHDNVINSGGVKIHAEHVEHLLRELLPADIASSRFYVTADPDDTWGERPVIITASPEDVQHLITAALSLDDKIKRPDRVYLVKTLIEANNAKIRRLSALQLDILSVNRIC